MIWCLLQQQDLLKGFCCMSIWEKAAATFQATVHANSISPILILKRGSGNDCRLGECLFGVCMFSTGSSGSSHSKTHAHQLTGDASGTWVNIECLRVDWMGGLVTRPRCIPTSDLIHAGTYSNTSEPLMGINASYQNKHRVTAVCAESLSIRKEIGTGKIRMRACLRSLWVWKSEKWCGRKRHIPVCI